MGRPTIKDIFLYRFSIIIPVYNVEKYVESCLKSLVNQTFKDFEIVIVDDGSKDSSMAVVKSYLSDKIVSAKIFTQKNSGQSTARNHGIQKVTGEYVLFLDSDDTFELNTLELLNNEILSNPDENFDYICFTRKDISETGIENHVKIVNYSFTQSNKILDKKGVNSGFLSFEDVSCAVTDKLFHISFFRKFYSDQIFIPGRYYEDHLFMMDAVLKTNKVLVTKHQLYRYLIREGSTMRTANMKIADDYFFLIDKLWKKKDLFFIDSEFRDQICFNHIFVQIVTFFQTLRNAGIQDKRDYYRIVNHFKELLNQSDLDIVLHSSFNSTAKNMLAKYFRSALSNYLFMNNLVFNIYDLMIKVRNRG